jgi:hypothetical protein
VVEDPQDVAISYQLLAIGYWLAGISIFFPYRMSRKPLPDF